MPMRPTAPDISQILLEEGLLSHDDLQRAQQEQIRVRKNLGRVLVDMGLVRESDLVAALAKQFDMRVVDLTDQVPDPAAVALIPPQMARRYVVIAYGFDADGLLLVATSDLANIVAFDDIRTATDREIRPVVAARSDIVTAIDRHVRVGKSIQDVADFHHGRDEDLRVVTVTDEEGDAPWSSSSTPSSRRRCRTVRPTYTSSPRSTRCACGTAWMACCTRSRRRTERSPGAW